MCANAHTFFGRRTAVRTAERRNTGIALMTSIYASVPTFFGNKRGARKDGPKNSGTGAGSARQPDVDSVGFRGIFDRIGDEVDEDAAHRQFLRLNSVPG